MAYTIISQNNTTTTLQDENGNIIYVPGRVTLATSTDYTITEVNNNTATLTDGSGKVIRDVPCVVVLAGGGSSDTHNKGYYATPEALAEAEPTAEAGDWAIVGSTDTVWVWDSDTTAWKDTDTKGQVTSVNGQTGDVTIDALPSQTGQSGKFLTTDGTDASWSDKPLVNTATGSGGTGIGDNCQCSGNYSVAVGYYAKANSVSATALGQGAEAGSRAVAVGEGAKATASGSIAIGKASTASSNCSLQINLTSSGTPRTNSDANTVKIANENGNFEIMSADGTVPSDRLTHAINKCSSMPTAASTNEGWIVQFTGTTDSTYTHGHLYECVSDGADPATYSWTEVSLGGGGSSYTAGTGIDITNNAISVVNPVVVASSSSTLPSTDSDNGLAIGTNAFAGKRRGTGDNTLAIGNSARATGNSAMAIGQESSAGHNAVAVGRMANASVNNVAIGVNAIAGSNGILIGCKSGATITGTANAFDIVLNQTQYTVVGSDGTIPTARLTKVNTTVTLAAASWSSNTQTVSVTGMTATGVVLVSPDPTDQSAYTSAGIICSAQAAGTLTFTCSTTPSADLSVNVVML